MKNMDSDYSDDSGSKLKSGIVEFIEFVAIMVAILVVVRFFIAEPHRVSGLSMFPNFHDQDYIITNKLAVTMGNPVRGEVVILHDPRSSDKVFIKRVIGLPGEKIKLEDGNVLINGKVLDEPYLPSGLKTPGETFLTEGDEITIPNDSYFVLGDNRPASSDSREFGPVKKDLLIGQAILRYWPVNKFALIQIGKVST